MVIILRDCFVEARFDHDDPDSVHIFARQKGDIERFTPFPNVRVSLGGDYRYTATLARVKFDQALVLATNNNSYLPLVESVSGRDTRRRKLYRSILQDMATKYGAFGFPGELPETAYPPDAGLPDDPDVAKFLQGE